MADNTTPSRAANMEKAEGDRESAENAGGISNRPFDEEVLNQEALPERGQSQAEERNRSAEDEWPPRRSDR